MGAEPRAFSDRRGFILTAKHFMSLRPLQAIEKHTSFSLILILLFTLFLKLLVLLRNPVINNDAVLYIKLAKDISLDGKILLNRPPFLPLLIAFFHIFIHNWLWAGHLVMIAALTLLVLPAYAIASHLWGKEGGLATALFVSVSPFFNKFACDLVKGPLFWLFALLFIYFLLKYLQTQKFSFLSLIGISFVLSLLSRREAVLLVIPAGVILLIQWMKGRRLIIKLLLAIASVVLIGILTSTPLWVYSYAKGKSVRSVYNTWSRTVRSELVFFSPVTNYRKLDKELRKVEKVMPAQGTSYNFAEIARHYIPVVYFVGFIELLGRVVYPLFFFLALLGIWKSCKERSPPEHCIVLFFLVLYLFLGLLYLNSRNWVDKRYVLFAALLFHFWIWPGFVRIRGYFENKKLGIYSFAQIVFVLLIMLPFLKTVTIKRGRELILRDSGQWIQRNGKIAGPVWCSDYRIAFYASRPVIRGSKEESAKGGDFGKKALKKGAAYIALKMKKGKTPVSQTNFTLVQKFPGSKKVIFLFKRRPAHDNRK